MGLSNSYTSRQSQVNLSKEKEPSTMTEVSLNCHFATNRKGQVSGSDMDIRIDKVLMWAHIKGKGGEGPFKKEGRY